MGLDGGEGFTVERSGKSALRLCFEVRMDWWEANCLETYGKTIPENGLRECEFVAPTLGMSLACSMKEGQVAGGRGDRTMGGQGPDICRLWLKREGERDFIPKPMES